MEKEKEAKPETKTVEKKTHKGKLWMYIWLASTGIYVLSFTNIFGSIKGTLAWLSFLISTISLIVWATKSRIVRRIILYGILLLFLFFVFYLLVAQPHRMNGDSMSPTLKNGDCVWSEKISYYVHPPMRDDIVFTANPSGSEEMVTRIIGLPNETVSYKPGEFKINGNVLNEQHINWGALPTLLNNWPEAQITLKDNEYLGFSDNQTPIESKNITTNETELKNALQKFLTTDETEFKNSLQKFLQDSVFTRQGISGKATSIKYSCK